jgi:adenylosuccinate synthase
MSATVICGMQWGDEGKGKVVDFLANESDFVVRYQGGNNAGHTVIVRGEKYVLHLLPSGVLNSKASCILAPGVLLDPKVLLEELDALEKRGLTVDHVLISERCHLILPYHIILDTLKEESLGKNKIGTTKRGIGPCYMDKFERSGLRAIDLKHPELLCEKIMQNTKIKNEIITKIYGAKPLDSKRICADFIGYAQRLAHRIIDSTTLLNTALVAQKRILFEGAQAIMLDIDHGNYPFVTSSSPTTGAVCVGAGISPHWLTRRIGVFKAYSTRVGSGPFPTELLDKVGDKIREIGHEFGSTTKRPRRCGWLDLVNITYAVTINGFTELALMKVDVLSHLPQIPLCLGYNLDGKPYHGFPADADDLARVEPQYILAEGWHTDVTHMRTFEELPIQLKAYITLIENAVGVPITTISVGPDREQTIIQLKSYA